MKYEDVLEQYGKLTYRNVGVSMMPLLKQGRDLFTVHKKQAQRCRKYDVILYRRWDGAYVLHRIIGVRENDYVVLGDNCICKEYGITDENILGVMESFVHKGKTYTVQDPAYRMYVFVHCHLNPLRIFYRKIRRKAGRMYRKLWTDRRSKKTLDGGE